MIITIKQGDTFPTLRAYLQQADSKPIRLNGCSVRFIMIDKDGTNIIDSLADVMNEDEGYVRYNWATVDTKDPGEYKAEFEITFQNGAILSVPNDGYFTINIVKQIG